MITLRVFCPICNAEFREGCYVPIDLTAQRDRQRRPLRNARVRYLSQAVFILFGGRCDDCLKKQEG